MSYEPEGGYEPLGAEAHERLDRIADEAALDPPARAIGPPSLDEPLPLTLAELQRFTRQHGTAADHLVRAVTALNKRAKKAHQYRETSVRVRLDDLLYLLMAVPSLVEALTSSREDFTHALAQIVGYSETITSLEQRLEAIAPSTGEDAPCPTPPQS